MLLQESNHIKKHHNTKLPLYPWHLYAKHLENLDYKMSQQNL